MYSIPIRKFTAFARAFFAIAVLCLLAGQLSAQTTDPQTPDLQTSGTTIVIDDFERDDGRSALGTSWQGFTDRVMGGLSDIQAGFIDGDDGRVMRMRGTVRLDNNGGFVQVRLPLAVNRRPMDLSDAEALELEVRGEPGPYYLHLRTTETRRPWAYYRAELPVSREWRRVRIPMDSFESVSTRRSLAKKRVVSLGLVAYGEEFEADLAVRSIAIVVSDDYSDSAQNTSR